MKPAGVKYQTIFKELQQELLAGKYASDQSLPSEMQLVRRFGVSRFTAAQAIAGLVKAGLAVRRKGKGTYPTRFARLSAGPIGLVMPGLAYGEIYAPICSEIVRLCQRHGRTVLLSNTSSGAPAAQAASALRLAQDFVRQHVTGVILHPIEYLRDSAGVNREIVGVFEKAGIPVVLLDYDITPLTGRSGYDLVGIDNYAAGLNVGEHLVERGAKKVVFVRRKNCATTVVLRTNGVAAAVTAAGGKWGRENVIETEAGDVRAVVRALRGKNRADALVFGYDALAVEVLKSVRKSLPNLAIPRDLKVAAFDDVRLASAVTPSLTTVRQPCNEMAQMAVEALFRRMADPTHPVSSIILQAPLVVRESTGGKA